MKDRRDRLKQLALDNLPATELEQLGLVSDRVLDYSASRVVHLLQERGICIPEALAVTRSRSLSVYQALSNPEDAELFFRIGFHDTESWYDPILSKKIWYINWLAKHGAISCQLKSMESAMDIFMANHIYNKIGENIKYDIFWDQLRSSTFDDELSISPLAARIAWIHKLNTVALPAKIADTCNCKCSDEGCTPFTSLLKSMSDYYGSLFSSQSPPPRPIQRLNLFLKYFGNDLEVRHHTAALRYLTYTALGIPHTCCSPYDKFLSKSEDVEDIKNEHVYELELLEELLGDFERQIIAILQDPNKEISDIIDFWECTWTKRMREVLNSLEGNDLTDEERRKAEEIGVIWAEPRPEAPKVVDNLYKGNTLDYWMYELEKIEAECQ